MLWPLFYVARFVLLCCGPFVWAMLSCVFHVFVVFPCIVLFVQCVCVASHCFGPVFCHVFVVMCFVLQAHAFGS